MSRHGAGKDAQGFERACEAFKAGQYDQASAFLQQILSHRPDDAPANHLLGMIAHLAGELQTAVEHLNRAIDAEPSRFMAYCHLGDVLYSSGKLEEARLAYQRSLALKPNNQPAKNGMWVVRKGLGEAEHYCSMEGQDEFIHQRYFGDKRNGVFVDIGAYDGVTGSNTCFFERRLGWTGVCFEPSTQQFEKLTRNRTARCINACVADYDGEAQFMDIVEGLTMMGGLVENYDPEMLAGLRNAKDQRLELCKVPVMRLSTFLEEAGIDEVDYCSIDVEGSEMKILRDLDFDKVRIEVFSIENNSRRSTIREFMYPAGYELVDVIGMDEIYQRRASGG